MTQTAHSTIDKEKGGFIANILKYAEFNKFGVMAMVLIFVGCISGVSVGLTIGNSDASLIAIIAPTMATMALILSLQPIKYILILGLITVIVDVLILTTTFL